MVSVSVLIESAEIDTNASDNVEYVKRSRRSGIHGGTHHSSLMRKTNE
jgi:hypothetical protein